MEASKFLLPELGKLVTGAVEREHVAALRCQYRETPSTLLTPCGRGASLCPEDADRASRRR